MKIFITYILGLVLLSANTAVAQEQSGIITYQAIINETYVDSFLTDLKQKDIPMNIKQGVVDMYSNATPDDYVLNFKNGESYYYHVPSLQVKDGLTMGSSAGTNSYYTNNEEQTIIEKGSLGYIAHNPLDWEITNKTKTLGGYQCYQAIATERLYSRQGHYYNRKAVAWFTPEIPLNFGPKHYKGLPGLILEINRDKFTIRATELNLNPDEDITIKRPSENATIITPEESHERIKEMESDRKKTYK